MGKWSVEKFPHPGCDQGFRDIVAQAFLALANLTN